MPALLKSLVGRRAQQGKDHMEIRNCLSAILAQLVVMNEDNAGIRASFEKKTVVVAEFLPLDCINGLARTFNVRTI